MQALPPEPRGSTVPRLENLDIYCIGVFSPRWKVERNRLSNGCSTPVIPVLLGTLGYISRERNWSLMNEIDGSRRFWTSWTLFDSSLNGDG